MEAEAEEVVGDFGHDDLTVNSVEVFRGHDSLGGDSGPAVDGGGLRCGGGHESVILDVDNQSSRNEGIVVDDGVSDSELVWCLTEYGYC